MSSGSSSTRGAKARLVDTAVVFRALAHPSRRHILLVLQFRGGKMTAGEADTSAAGTAKPVKPPAKKKVAAGAAASMKKAPVKKKVRRKKKRPAIAAPTAAESFSIGDIQGARRLADQLGGAARAKALLDVLD